MWDGDAVMVERGEGGRGGGVEGFRGNQRPKGVVFFSFAQTRRGIVLFAYGLKEGRCDVVTL